LSPLANLGAKSKGQVVAVSLDQLWADMKSQAAPQCSIKAVSLLGCWVDSRGSMVLVHTGGASSQQLIATLMRPSLPDMSLSLWQPIGSRVWRCGGAVLDATRSSTERLHWVFSDGSVGAWTWCNFTLEALAMRRLATPEDGLLPASFPQQMPTALQHAADFAPSSEEWAPVRKATECVC